MEENSSPLVSPGLNWLVAMIVCGIIGALLPAESRATGIVIVLLAWISLQIERLIAHAIVLKAILTFSSQFFNLKDD